MTVSPTLLIRILVFHNNRCKFSAVILFDWEYCSIKFIVMYRFLETQNNVLYRWMCLPTASFSVRLLAGYRRILTSSHGQRWKTDIICSDQMLLQCRIFLDTLLEFVFNEMYLNDKTSMFLILLNFFIPELQKKYFIVLNLFGSPFPPSQANSCHQSLIYECGS